MNPLCPCRRKYNPLAVYRVPGRVLGIFLLTVVLMLDLCGLLLTTGQAAQSSAVGGKLSQRVIYFGDLNSARAKDFLDFLRRNFAIVGSANLDPFDEKATEGYDVVILDYGELKISNNRIQMPTRAVHRGFDRPTMTLGATGALVSDRLGLKTGYL